MPEKGKSGIGIFAGSQLSQSGIGIPASRSVLYRWSRISPSLPNYEKKDTNNDGNTSA
jgi:hypothetical protein